MAEVQSNPQRGFTLLETLVAFVIAAAAFAALAQAAAAGLRAASITAHTIDAWHRAESRLAAQLGPFTAAADTAGDDGDGFTWHATIRQRATAPPNLRLYTIAIKIAWRLDGPERHVVLTTDRLSP